jgi:tetratricopeptide (TPR) repeat protein
LKGRVFFALLAPALAMCLFLQWHRGMDRIQASVLLRQVEGRTLQAAAAGALSEELLRSHLQALRRASELDPSEAGILTARGSHFLLLGRPEAAAETYRQALALEPRPEQYLNLGRALVAMGRTEEADEMFAIAVRIDPRLRRQIPDRNR